MDLHRSTSTRSFFSSRIQRLAVTAAAALLSGLTGYRAQATADCTELVTRVNVVECALRASLTVRAEEQGLQSVEGRRQAASVLLPSNPTISVSGAYPVEPGLERRPMLYSVAVSQELQISGQRGARLRVAAAEARAQQSRVLETRREAVARALLAYFDIVASAEELDIAERLTSLADALNQVAAERAKVGVGSELDASLADAAAVRIAQLRSAAAERQAVARATLNGMLGLSMSAQPRVEGELVPLPVIDASPKRLLDGALVTRTELSVIAAERDLYESRVEVYRRQRVPNPTVSLFGRSDWIGERTIGIGLGVPIPLPAPLGQTYAGEIAEWTAMSHRAKTQADEVRRRIATEVATALARVDASRLRVALYTPERVQKAQLAFTRIAAELTAGRLPPREALLAQQGLVEVLSGYVEARRGLCSASVALATAAGIVLEQGAQ